jgi:hypothetical protein
MTIKELEKMYPPKKYEWYAFRGNFPDFSYKDNDIVVDYKLQEKVKSTDITDALFKKDGKIKISYVNRIRFNWRRA